MSKAFYYADTNSQPVGPLSLEEIRKFADADVVSRDVMVCEAGGDNWRSLETFDGGGIDPSLTVTPSTKSSPLADMSPETLVRSLRITFNATIAVSLAGFALDTIISRGAIQTGDPFYTEGAMDQFAMMLAFLSIAGSAALIYLVALSLPERHRFTTPVKAAGFFLIPVFSIYWAFRLLPGLVKGTRQWWLETAPGKSWRLAWLAPIAFVTAGILAVGQVLDSLSIFWIWGNPPAKGWQALVFFSGFVYALGSTAAFEYAYSLIQVHGRLVDPEGYERGALKVKNTPIWNRRVWSPSPAYLFPIIFIGIWMMRIPQ